MCLNFSTLFLFLFPLQLYLIIESKTESDWYRLVRKFGGEYCVLSVLTDTKSSRPPLRTHISLKINRFLIKSQLTTNEPSNVTTSPIVVKQRKKQ